MAEHNKINPDPTILAICLDAVLPPGEADVPPEDDNPLVNTASRLAAMPKPQISGQAKARIEDQLISAYRLRRHERQAQPLYQPRPVRWRPRRLLAAQWMMAASVILALLIIGLTPILESTRGPVLADALRPPYALDQRPLPESDSDAEALLPASLGPYARLDAAAPSDEQFDLLCHCLLGECGVAAARCDLHVDPVTVTWGQYAGEEAVVHLAAAQFQDSEAAITAMVDLHSHARSVGRTGNFVIGGVGPVDFFYSAAPGWISFTWSRGVWVFSISGTSIEVLEAAIETLPY